MADTALNYLRRSIDDLAAAVAMLSHMHGKVPVVARLCLDLDQLRLDAADTQGLLPSDTPVDQSAEEQMTYTISDEPYDQSMWDGADQEGVGGYHGSGR